MIFKVPPDKPMSIKCFKRTKRFGQIHSFRWALLISSVRGVGYDEVLFVWVLGPKVVGLHLSVLRDLS